MLFLFLVMFGGVSSILARFFSENNNSTQKEQVIVLLNNLKKDLINSDLSILLIDQIYDNINKAIANVNDVESVKSIIFSIFYNKVHEFLGSSYDGIALNQHKMTVIMVCGSQGVGKTTFVPKLCKQIKQENPKIRIAACSVDIKRPAAQIQLKNTLKKEGIDFISLDNNHNFTTLSACATYLHTIASKSGYSVLVVDTQGISSVNIVEMKRLSCVKEIIKPDETLLALDATMGQVSSNIAAKFNKSIGITGFILTKIDSDTNGAIAINIRSVVNKPIKYLSNGEKINNLEKFHPNRIAKRILNLGDIDGLRDMLKSNFQKDVQISLAAKIMNNKFDFNDLQEQLIHIKNTDTISSIFHFLPIKSIQEKIKKQKLIHKQIAIIDSMTKKERENPDCINKSRHVRIANGSGYLVSDVCDVINRLTRLKNSLINQSANV